MKIKVEASKVIDEGTHTGAIIEVRYREKPYAYTDVVIEFEEGNKLMYGVPTNLTPDSKLGILLTLFGGIVDVGAELDPADILVGKECTFLTVNDGKYANIVPNSLKPSVHVDYSGGHSRGVFVKQ